MKTTVRFNVDVTVEVGSDDVLVKHLKQNAIDSAREVLVNQCNLRPSEDLHAALSGIVMNHKPVEGTERTVVKILTTIFGPDRTDRLEVVDVPISVAVKL